MAGHVDRRRFLQTGAGALAAACVGCNVFIGNRSTDLELTPEGRSVGLVVSRHEQLQRSGGQLVIEVAGHPAELLVFRRPSGELAATALKCTHQGCDLDYEADRDELTCPCHDSRFGVDGSVREGPAEAPLRTYRTELVGERLVIHLAG